ncbi:MAG: Maf family protein [Phycisphaerae bacterium]|jgi:septum formation protein|nr:Maf family protein [Phycisphaerae bacterium]
MSDRETLILASSSPRRETLMRQAGLHCRVVHPPIHEPDDIDEGLTPAGHAEALAYFKASSVRRIHAEAVVLGADTVVSIGEEILGKASGPEHAAAMLARLSGTQHEVITGVALLGAGHWRTIASETTRITMRTMTPDEIDRYVESGEWRGKAGAYAIQETADRFVVKVDGSFSNVVGLPMELVTRMLAAIDARGRPRSGGV